MNAPAPAETETGRVARVLSVELWSVLMTVGVVLVWLAPAGAGGSRWQPGLRALGAGLLVILAFLYRNSEVTGLIQLRPQWWGILTYDFREAEADTQAGHHANLYTHPSDLKQRSADRAVREFLAAGVPPSKLVLGVPFYARAWGEVKPDDNGLYQPGKPLAEPIETLYASLAAQLVDRNGYVRLWDRESQAPSLWNAEKRVFISYEDPESLRTKCRYILDPGLAGAMFWEYYADRTGALLGTLFAELRGKPAG